METIKDVLAGAKALIQKTDWCQGQYALKNGKTCYDFLSSGEIADSYCFVGACDKVAFDMWKATGDLSYPNQQIYNKLSLYATRWVVELQKFDGCPADWNDQDENVRRLSEFTAELRAKSVPRDKAKGELNKFKQELKALNLPPVMTKEKILGAIDFAIAALEC